MAAKWSGLWKQKCQLCEDLMEANGHKCATDDCSKGHLPPTLHVVALVTWKKGYCLMLEVQQRMAALSAGSCTTRNTLFFRTLHIHIPPDTILMCKLCKRNLRRVIDVNNWFNNLRGIPKRRKHTWTLSTNTGFFWNGSKQSRVKIIEECKDLLSARIWYFGFWRHKEG